MSDATDELTAFKQKISNYMKFIKDSNDKQFDGVKRKIHKAIIVNAHKNNRILIGFDLPLQIYSEKTSDAFEVKAELIKQATEEKDPILKYFANNMYIKKINIIETVIQLGVAYLDKKCAIYRYTINEELFVKIRRNFIVEIPPGVKMLSDHIRAILLLNKLTDYNYVTSYDTKYINYYQMADNAIHGMLETLPKSQPRSKFSRSIQDIVGKYARFLSENGAVFVGSYAVGAYSMLIGKSRRFDSPIQILEIIHPNPRQLTDAMRDKFKEYSKSAVDKYHRDFFGKVSLRAILGKQTIEIYSGEELCTPYIIVGDVKLGSQLCVLKLMLVKLFQLITTLGLSHQITTEYISYIRFFIPLMNPDYYILTDCQGQFMSYGQIHKAEEMKKK